MKRIGIVIIFFSWYTRLRKDKETRISLTRHANR